MLIQPYLLILVVKSASYSTQRIVKQISGSVVFYSGFCTHKAHYEMKSAYNGI